MWKEGVFCNSFIYKLFIYNCVTKCLSYVFIWFLVQYFLVFYLQHFELQFDLPVGIFIIIIIMIKGSGQQTSLHSMSNTTSSPKLILLLIISANTRCMCFEIRTLVGANVEVVDGTKKTMYFAKEAKYLCPSYIRLS